jgi:hypothetical protein
VEEGVGGGCGCGTMMEVRRGSEGEG